MTFSPAFAVQAFRLNACFGGTIITPRIFREVQGIGIEAEYFDVVPGLQCSTETTFLPNETRRVLFPFDECGLEPFNFVQEGEDIFMRALSGLTTAIPPFDNFVGAPQFPRAEGEPISFRSIFSNSNCAGLPVSFLYTPLDQCVSVINPLAELLITPGISRCEDSGASSVTQFTDMTCSESTQRFSFATGTCLAVSETASFLTLCNFPPSSSEDEMDQIIILSTVFPVIFICVFICLICGGFYFLTFKREREQINHFKEMIGDVPQVEDVEILELIGSGNFGNVYKGLWNSAFVALKELKIENSSESIREMEIMAQCRHPNVLSFYGVTFFVKTEKTFMVMEYMSGGDLLNFLHKEFEIAMNTLHQFVVNTASGMEYLHNKNIIHRDLAARNILVSQSDSGYSCKISDFGMSRILQENDNYQRVGNPIPIRWSAPEAIEFGKFQESSDVWSFGVTCWEIYSRGATPYAGVTNEKILRLIKKGNRLHKPSEAPMSVWKLITHMWNIDPKKRPSFKEIKQKLSQSRVSFEPNKSSAELISNTSDLKSRDSPPTDDQTYAFTPDMTLPEKKNTEEENMSGKIAPRHEQAYYEIANPSSWSSLVENKQLTLEESEKVLDQCEKNYREAKQRYKDSKRLVKEMRKKKQQEPASETSPQEAKLFPSDDTQKNFE